MDNRRRALCVSVCMLALSLAPGHAEGVATEYLANLAAEDVLSLEERLNALGYLSQKGDSVYDSETRQALQSFQQANGLQATGQPDEATLARLDAPDAVSRQDYLRGFIQEYQELEPMKSGDINNQVQAIQRRLQQYGYFSGSVDGVYGETTRQAVERFQMVNGLPVTGEADGMTLMRLMADVPITWQGYLSEMSCAAGDSGLNVYVLQRRLMEMGYFDGDCTASFGDLTRQAVARFQAENGLEDTGVADASLWERLYSKDAVALRSADVLELGDTGDAVVRVQRRLSALGYYGAEDGGSFDYATQTAVRLFQMANGLTATGRVDATVLAVLDGDAALPLGDAAVQQRFATLLSNRDGGVQGRIAEIANQLVGAEFRVQDDALYPGFALVQYVCVAAGLPITTPESVIRLAEDEVESPSEVEAGNILAFQTANSDSVTMLMTIGAGEGRIIYAAPEIGWVVMSYMNQIDSESIYRWAERAS